MSYFENLASDLHTIGLGAEPIPSNFTVGDLFRTIGCTANIGTERANVILPDPSYMSTELGMRVLQLVEDGVIFSGKYSIGSCSDVESRIDTASLMLETPGFTGRWPVIIHDDNRVPIAFIKHHGDSNAYGLVDRPEIELYAGAIAYYSEPSLAPTKHETAPRFVPNNLNVFSPVRFTLFSTPSEDRLDVVLQRELSSLRMPTTPHEEIVNRINSLVKDHWPEG